MITDIPWVTVIELALIGTVLGFSQYLPFRAGVFSLATAGFAEIGAYTNAWMSTHGWSAFLSAVGGVVVTTAVATVLAWPLSRLRGVFQGIASIAFLQVVQNIAFVWTSVTGGPVGINGIPRWATLWPLVAVVAVLAYVFWRFEHSVVGEQGAAVRIDELAAASCGMRVFTFHLWAMIGSGALGGLGGVLLSANQYSITPDGFGFTMAITVVSYVFIGGFRSWMGAVFGAFLIVTLPFLSQSVQEYRSLVTGILLIGVVVLLPRGAVDSVRMITRAQLAKRG